MEFVDEKLHQLVASDGSKANATIITASHGEGNYNLSSLDDGMSAPNPKNAGFDIVIPKCYKII